MKIIDEMTNFLLECGVLELKDPLDQAIKNSIRLSGIN